MKTLPYHKRRKQKSTFELLVTLWVAMMVLGIIMTLTSCQLTVSGDGTRTWSLNAEDAMRAIIIHEGK